MGRDHTFWDSEYENNYYNENDNGDFIKNTVFIAMPFSEDMEDVFINIKEEVLKLNLKAIRVDKSIGSGLILKKITKGIEECEFLIFDLTNEKPNVYYELGYAHGVGNESMDILLIAKAGTKIHFDIAPLKIEIYSSIEELRSIVYKNLKMMIEITRN